MTQETSRSPSESDHRNLRSKRVVNALPIRSDEYRVYDKQLPGFGLRIAPTGLRAFFVRYRHRGVSRKMYLGDTRTLAPAQAYRLAFNTLAKVKSGVDPLAERRAQKENAIASARARRGAATVADVAERYLKTLSLKGSVKWTAEATRLYKAHIEPALGKKKVVDITVPDVRSLHEKLHKTEVTANRVRAILSTILARARADGDIPATAPNPCAVVEPYEEKSRERYLSADEWKRLGKAIRAERTALANVRPQDTRRAQLDAIIMLALTGARTQAMLRRRWSDFDSDGRVLRVDPAHKGTTRVYLGENALTLIRTWHHQRAGADPFIFPGQTRKLGRRTARGPKDVRPKRGAVPIAWIRPVWESLCERAKLSDVHPHDLRRSFATVAGDVGISGHLIGGLLSHVVPGVTGIYAHRTDPALADAANKVAAEIVKRLELDGAVDPHVIPISNNPARRRARA